MKVLCLANDPPRISRLLSELKQCTQSRNLQMGKRLHKDVALTGLIANSYVLSSLINMYAKCEDMVHAKMLFDSARTRNAVAWNCLIWGYIDNGKNELALEMFDVMTQSEVDCSPNARTYVAALTACSNLGASNKPSRARWLVKGRTIHSRAVNMRCCDMFVENTIVDMYIKCGSMEEARMVFERMKHRDVVSWTALLQGYVDSGEFQLALHLFDSMQSEAVPDARTYVVLLTACASWAEEKADNRRMLLEKARAFHTQALRTFCCDIYVESTLINVYAKCGSMVQARKVFDRMTSRNVVSWTALLQGYVENGEPEVALELFDMMESAQGGCQPNSRTFLVAIMACAAGGKSEKQRAQLLIKARRIHSLAVEKRCCSLSVENALVDMYGQCGSMSDARKTFDSMVYRDVVTWTCLIRGYVQNGESLLAVELFDCMEKSSVSPNGMTYVAVLAGCSTLVKACRQTGSTTWLKKAEALYHQALVTNCCDIFVQTTMLGVFAKAGKMVSARTVFDNMRQKSVVTWNTLLQGYVEEGDYKLVLEMFDRMESSQEGSSPDARTYVCALTACGRLAKFTSGEDRRWLEKGKKIHSRAMKHRCCDTFVDSALVDLYSSFGCMKLAHDVFNHIASPDVVSWNCLIQGYVDNGENKLALELFAAMKLRKVSPTSSTFLAALGACGRLMAIERGEALHAEIRESGLEQDGMVATSLMDFYGRCGKVDVARQVFESMTRKDVQTWNSLMSTYSRQGNVEQVLGLFDDMIKQGVKPDTITFTHLLNACSHAGLTSKGREIFDSMETKFGIKQDIIHFNCMCDLLGRANHLDEALKMVKAMPMEPNEVTWTSMLAACRKWNNVAIGTLSYQSLQRVHREKTRQLLEHQ